MRTLATFSMLVVGALVVPAVYAGSQAEPELTDGVDNSAPGALDVLSAWWTAEADNRVRINIKVRDLLTSGQPAADGLPGDATDGSNEIRYYYEATFTPSSTGSSIEIRCIVGAVDSSPVRGQWQPGNGGVAVGTDCRASPVQNFNNQAAFNTNTEVDRLNGILTIILTERANPVIVDIGAGTTFSDLAIETSSGTLEDRLFIPIRDDNLYQKVYDVAGPGLAWTQ